MLLRALILLLLVLNVGVASWWAFAPATAPVEPTLPASAPRLQLLAEVPARARPKPAAPAPIAAASPVNLPAQCWRLGPFTDAAALARARSWLQSRVMRVADAALPTGGRGWRVWLPPLSDRDAAQAMALRIASAGFKDYYVVPEGAEANSIALGRYGNADAAQRRQAALQAAGFQARAEPLGGSAPWLEVAANAPFDADAARVATGAAQVRPLDCAQLH